MLDNGSKVPFEEPDIGEFMETEIKPVPKETGLTLALADRLADEFLIIISDCSMSGDALSFTQMHKILAGLFRAYGEGVMRGAAIHEITKNTRKEKPVTLRELQESIKSSKNIDD